MATRYRGLHEECGFLGKPTSKGRAARALRDHSCDRQIHLAIGVRRPLPVAGDPYGLSIELDAGIAAPGVGDWVVTRAGSRYLVIACRVMQHRTPGPLVRYRLRCIRQAWQSPIPADVRVIELRGRASSKRPVKEER